MYGYISNIFNYFLNNKNESINVMIILSVHSIKNTCYKCHRFLVSETNIKNFEKHVKWSTFDIIIALLHSVSTYKIVS